MARILVLDPELRNGHTLVDMLRRLGHAPDLQPRLPPSLEASGAAPVEAVFACASDRTVRDMASAWGSAGLAQPLVWCSRFLETVEPFQAAGVGDAFLALPPRMPALMAVVQRFLDTAADAGWSGDRFLQQVDGTARRFPPARVAFLAHRVAATGTLHVGGARLVLHSGRVTGCAGVPGLLGTDGLDLMSALGVTIAQGTSPDEAMRRAAEELGCWLRTTPPPEEPVSWVDGSHLAKRSPVTLPLSVPRMVMHGVRATGAAAARRARFLAAGNPTFRVCAPDDAPETQWGLSPVALRVLRAATRRPALLDLLDALGGREQDELWEALDFLLTLGLLRERDDGTAVAADVAGQALPEIEAVGGEVSISIEALDEAVGRRAAPVARSPEEQALSDEIARIEDLEPWDVFALEGPDGMVPAALDARLRELSTSHHPDRHATAEAGVRELHERLFAIYSDAHSALMDEKLRPELRARLQAKAAGKPYVSDADRKKARLHRTKGEHALRARRWDEATAELQAACAADPLDVGLAALSLEARWRGGQLEPAAALQALGELRPSTLGERAELAFLRGELQVAAGDEASALASFQETLEIQPSHVGAQRRVRMHERRQAKAQDSEKRGGLAGLFGFGRRKG